MQGLPLSPTLYAGAIQASAARGFAELASDILERWEADTQAALSDDARSVAKQQIAAAPAPHTSSFE